MSIFDESNIEVKPGDWLEVPSGMGGVFTIKVLGYDELTGAGVGEIHNPQHQDWHGKHRSFLDIEAKHVEAPKNA